MGASFSSARGFALAATGFLQMAACTSLLGIDGEYGVDKGGDGGRSAGAAGQDSSGGDPSGSAGAGGTTTDTGGGSGAVVQVGTGGAVGSGGASGSSSGGITSAPPIDAGSGGACTNCPPPPDLGPCTPGVYQGSQSGMHTPTVTVVLPFTVDGDVAFRLGGADGGGAATISDGHVKGSLVIIMGTTITAPFTATITGTVDCATGRFNGVLDGGSTGPQSIKFHGSYTGSFSGGAFNGKWSETEPTGTGKGNGIWDAHKTGP